MEKKLGGSFGQLQVTGPHASRLERGQATGPQASDWTAGIPACNVAASATSDVEVSYLFSRRSDAHAGRDACGPAGTPVESSVASLINSGINTASGSVGQCLTGSSRFIVFVFKRKGLKIER